MGDDTNNLTPKQAGEAAVKQFLLGLYRRELQAVDAAAANADDRETISQMRADIEALVVDIKVREQTFRDQADTDMGSI